MTDRAEDAIMDRRIGFEPCTDDGPWGIAQFCALGHHPASFWRLLALGRALHYEWGYRHDEARDLLERTTFHHGWLGEHPSKFDLIACEESGESWEYDDDEPIICTKISPATWATIKLDPPDNGSEEGDRG